MSTLPDDANIASCCPAALANAFGTPFGTAGALPRAPFDAPFNGAFGGAMGAVVAAFGEAFGLRARATFLAGASRIWDSFPASDCSVGAAASWTLRPTI